MIQRKAVRLLAAGVFLSAVTPANAQGVDRYDGPIIDMHLHAFDEVDSERQLCFPSPCEGAATKATSGDQLKPMTLAAMERNNIVMGVISGERDVVLSWTEGEGEKFYAGILLFSPTDVPMKELRSLYQSGRVRVLGEIATQYSNIAIDDASLDPLLAMAHELDIPVHVHVLGAGGSPDFPSHLGNPLRLVPVLRKYPGLRVYLENAGWPFLEEVTALMYQYPSVYADVSTILHLMPRPVALKYLRGLVENGLGKRIMFGSDQMVWPEVIDVAVEVIQSADFLTLEQKADIFYNNAARFLRLDEATIGGHQHAGRATSGSVLVDGAELRWVREGRGPAVFVPGSSVYYRKAFSARLRDEFELVFIDGRHFVPSYAPDPETLAAINLATFADDVEAIRVELGYDKIVVVGHSIHGQIALEYADRYPGSTSAVVLIGAVPYASGEFASAAAAIWEELASDERKALLASRTADLSELIAATPPSRTFAVTYNRRGPLYWADPTYDATELLAGLENGPAFERLAATLPTRNEARARLKRIRAPILLVLGKLDFAVPYTAWEDLISDVDNLEYVLLDADSHNPQTENPARFDPIMIGWLK